MTEAETKAQERAEQMKAWFSEREVPKEVNLNGHGNIFDTKQYIETAIATINHSIINSNPFRASYMNLYRLKKELEQHDNNR